MKQILLAVFLLLTILVMIAALIFSLSGMRKGISITNVSINTNTARG